MVKALLNIFCQHEIPKTVLLDQGTQFMSNAMKATCKQLGVKQIGTAYNQMNDSMALFYQCSGTKKKVGVVHTA